MPKGKAKAGAWSESVGAYGARVRVYERAAGAIYASIADPLRPGRYLTRRLPGLGRDQAKAWAHDQASRILKCEGVSWPGEREAPGYQPTWANLFATYLAVKTPGKSDGEQTADAQRVELWTRVLGASTHPKRMTIDIWQRMQRDRAAGVIDPRGELVEKVEKRRPVRPRVVQAECQWLRQVCRWATDNWKDPQGKPILDRSPVAGLAIPTDGEPRQPVVTPERWKAVRAAAEAVTMQTRHAGPEHAAQKSYLPEILDLLQLTGHRVSAVLQLRWEDVRFDVEGLPQGAIRWPGVTDKTGFEHSVPMNAAIRQVIERVRRQRPGLGPTYLFPKPGNRNAAVGKDLVRAWLLKAEKLAGVSKQDGSLFHAYRRAWATARKHLSLKDVAAAGGWKRTETLMRHYIQADAATMLQVLDEPLGRQA